MTVRIDDGYPWIEDLPPCGGSDIARSHQALHLHARTPPNSKAARMSHLPGMMSARYTCDAETLAASNEEVKTASTRWIRGFTRQISNHDVPSRWDFASSMKGRVEDHLPRSRAADLQRCLRGKVSLFLSVFSLAQELLPLCAALRGA